MSKHHIREDKTCSNCTTIVEQRFCPNCGQENIETRQSFKHLFSHFFEDLTHYDSAFWKTIKFLLFYPAKLTKEYLSGKRQAFVPPVRLYLFISFITFLTPALIPKTGQEAKEEKNIEIREEKASTNGTKPETISFLGLGSNKYKTVAEMDSIQNTLPEEERLGLMEYWLNEKIIELHQEKTIQEIKEKFKEALVHNFPKSIFIYLPILGFWLWLFHGKKRWLYFDHCIFTLHYISFLLLSSTIFNLLDYVFSLIHNEDVYMNLITITSFTIGIWSVVYFFIAHKKMYGETRLISFTKSSILYFANFLCVIFILLILILYTLFNLS